jgi:hypothetical protein
MPEAITRIPIILADRPGFEGVTDSYKSPVIELGLGYDPSADVDGDRPFAKGALLNVRALIDSGADDFVVDISLLQRINAPIASQLPPVSIKTIHGTQMMSRFFVDIMFPGTQFKARVDVMGAEISDGTRAYEAIFGMRFIELGTLQLNPRGESHFTFA